MFGRAAGALSRHRRYLRRGCTATSSCRCSTLITTSRCFLPVHVYHVESGRPVAVLLRPGKTPSGVEVRILLKHLVRRIRRHWPRTRLTSRCDSHYGRTEAMAWCEANGVDYIFGLAGNAALHRLAYEADADRMRGFASFEYFAGSVAPEAPRRRPAGGDDPRLRRALHRHLAQGRGSASLRDRILCPRTGGKADQMAQRPTRLRPNLLPEPARQPVPPGPAHRRLLADARAPRCRAAQDAARLVRVRHHPQEPAQDQPPLRGEDRPHPHPLRLGLSRRRPVPTAAGPLRHLRTLIVGAPCPAKPETPQPPTPTPTISYLGTEWAPNGRRCAFGIGRYNRPVTNRCG